MKKIIITTLMIVFQLLSCKGQDFKKDIIGNWEQEFYDASGDPYYKGEIWSFYSDGTCQINYGVNSSLGLSKFTYEITNNDCSENPIKDNIPYYLKMTVVSGEDVSRCLFISEINTIKNSEQKILMLLYVYGANGSNVFVKR